MSITAPDITEEGTGDVVVGKKSHVMGRLQCVAKLGLMVNLGLEVKFVLL